MKKFMLAAFALAVFVSNSWAVECQYNGTQAYCQWATGCWDISTQYASVTDVCGTNDNQSLPECTCEQAIAGCEKDGDLFINVGNNGVGNGKSCQNDGNGNLIGEPSVALGCCEWSAGTCWTINAGIDPEDGKDGTVKLEECPNLISNSACSSSNGTCPSGTGGNDTGNSGNTPILISVPKVAGLTVVSNGNVLHILSAQDATISLFDIRGTKVLSGKASAGKNSTISLESQKQGIYYAVVQSGSHKQTLKVVLK